MHALDQLPTNIEVARGRRAAGGPSQSVDKLGHRPSWHDHAVLFQPTASLQEELDARVAQWYHVRWCDLREELHEAAKQAQEGHLTHGTHPVEQGHELVLCQRAHTVPRHKIVIDRRGELRRWRRCCHRRQDRRRLRTSRILRGDDGGDGGVVWQLARRSDGRGLDGGGGGGGGQRPLVIQHVLTVLFCLLVKQSAHLFHSSCQLKDP
mmetsp:Transcript_15664/g.36498  ORF Transcript_15664/g.36498 Transcript_15664/m.36498 type:complete len:208 (+) Transcript_15664:1238-1861(+)